MNDGIKISEMPQLEELHDSTVVAGVDRGINYKIPAKLLKGKSTQVSVEQEDGKVTIEVTDEEETQTTEIDIPTAAQLEKLGALPNIKSIGEGLELNKETGELTAPDTAKLYDAYGENTDGALNQKFASEKLQGLETEAETLQKNIDTEATSRQESDNNLQTQIDALSDRSDVVDVVDTYAELQSYDTSKLGDNDVIKVLNDETHNGAITYYRWNKTEGEWKYVGATGPYYTKAETDEKLQAETTAREQAVEGIQHDIENLTELVPTVVQETGESETDVMSQKAVTEALKNAGGSDVELLAEYSETPTLKQAYNAAYINIMVGNINTLLETLISGTGAKA